jgi:hypothetical protein
VVEALEEEFVVGALPLPPPSRRSPLPADVEGPLRRTSRAARFTVAERMGARPHRVSVLRQAPSPSQGYKLPLPERERAQLTRAISCALSSLVARAPYPSLALHSDCFSHEQSERHAFNSRRATNVTRREPDA